MTQPELQNILFIDDDQFILDALRASLRKQRKRWNMTFALGGAAGIEVIQKTPIDAVITDMQMPEVSGYDVLKAAYEHVPDAIRIVMSGQAGQAVELASMPLTHQWLSKPTDVAYLIHVIERALVTRNLVHAGPGRRLLGSLTKMPVIPTTYQALTRALAADEASVDAVTEIVSSAPGLSARLLQMANSAYYGLPRRLSDLREAVGYLGFEMISKLVFATEFLQQVEEGGPSAALAGFEARAILTSRVAAHIMDGDPRAEAASSAGLMHDIGRLLVEITDEVNGGKGVSIAQELRDCDATHSDIGGALLGIWGLPSELVEAVAHHREPSRVEIMELDCVVAVHVAQCLVSECIALQEDSQQPPSELDQAVIERLSLRQQLTEWREFAQDLVTTGGDSGTDAESR